MKQIIINHQDIVIAFVDTEHETIVADIDQSLIKDCSDADWQKSNESTVWQWTTDGLIEFVEPSPDPALIAQQLTKAAQAAVQETLDAKARERAYDGILSLCTYATSTFDEFKLEGQAGVNWRDGAWAKLYQLQADITAGKVTAPTTAAASAALALSVLPAMRWPDEEVASNA